jgi:hypothetical protein
VAERELALERVLELVQVHPPPELVPARVQAQAAGPALEVRPAVGVLAIHLPVPAAQAQAATRPVRLPEEVAALLAHLAAELRPATG